MSHHEDVDMQNKWDIITFPQTRTPPTHTHTFCLQYSRMQCLVLTHSALGSETPFKSRSLAFDQPIGRSLETSVLSILWEVTSHRVDAISPPCLGRQPVSSVLWANLVKWCDWQSGTVSLWPLNAYNVTV